MFPLQARFINPVRYTIKNSFLMALSHLPTTVLLIAVYAVPVVVFYFVPQSLPILILLAFGLIVYLKSFLLLRVFRRYEEAFAAGTEAPVTDPSEADSGIFAESDRIEREGKMVKIFRNGKFVEVPEKSLNNENKGQNKHMVLSIMYRNKVSSWTNCLQDMANSGLPDTG